MRSKGYSSYLVIYMYMADVCVCSVRGGVMQEMLAGSLVPGDTVHISLGDRIPADLRLVEVQCTYYYRMCVPWGRWVEKPWLE